MLQTESKKEDLSVHLSIVVRVIALQIEHSWSTLSWGAQWGLSVINNAVWKQRDILMYLGGVKGTGWHGHHLTRLLESDKGVGALQERLFGPRAAQVDGYPSYWHPLQTNLICKWGKTGHFWIYLVSLILYIWKNSWRDRWVKWSMICNPCSVLREKISSYFSNPLCCPPWMLAFTSCFTYMS